MVKLPIVNSFISLVRKSPPRVPPPRDANMRLRAAFDSAPVGIACAGIDGRWLAFNERFRELVGYSREQLTRFAFSDITHPDDSKVESVLVRRLLSGEVPNYRIDKRIIEKKGKYREVTIIGTVVRTEAGDADFFVYIADEPPRAAGRNTSRENEQLLASVLERISEIAIIRTDERGIITSWNAGAQRIFGYKRDEVVGKPRRMLYRDPDNWEGKSTQQMGAASDSGRIELEDWRVTRDGRHLWVQTSIMPVRPDGSTVKGFIEVVSAPAKRGEAAASNDVRTLELKHTIDALREDIDLRMRTEESLREALEEMRRVGSETMNELKIMAGALRNEMDRRKLLEAELQQARDVAAAPPPAPAPEDLAVEQPLEPPPLPKRAWKKLTTPVPELLIAHAAAQSTGTLVVAMGEQQTEVFFEHGRIFSVASNDPSRFLAQRLIEQGVITEEQRQRALEIQRETHLALGRILVLLNAIGEDRLTTAMRAKAEEDIGALFGWTDARFAFVEGEIPTLQLVPLRIDAASLVVQRLDERSRLLTDADVPDMEVPPPPALSETPVIDAILFASASGRSRKVHRASCPSARRVDEETRVFFTSVDDAATAGYEACRLCLRDA
jgi:PAS domain S-box-containing protein